MMKLTFHKTMINFKLESILLQINERWEIWAAGEVLQLVANF